MGQRTGSINHTHRYMLKQMGASSINPVWKCSLPGCSHFIPGNTEVWGRKSICWECGQTFTMDENYSVEYGDMPKCIKCMDLLEQGVLPSSQSEKSIYDLNIPEAPLTRAQLESESSEDSPEREELKFNIRQLAKRIEALTGVPGINIDTYKQKLKELEEQLENM